MTVIGFLGTGAMGLPMARHLSEAGLEVRAWNRTPERAEPLRDHGVSIAADPGQAASGAGLLVTMLSDADAVLEAAPPALSQLAGDGMWLQMSTIGLAGTTRCAECAAQAGVTLIDAPVLGTRQPAEEGKLVVLASGPEPARARCQAVFDAVGTRTLWLGDAGAGTRLKLVVNNWLVGLVTLLGETLALAEGLKLEPEHFLRAIDGGGLDLPYAKLKGKSMINREFDPSFRLALAAKDAGLVREAGVEAGLELPLLEAVIGRFAAAEQAGHGDEDLSAVRLAY